MSFNIPSANLIATQFTSTPLVVDAFKALQTARAQGIDPFNFNPNQIHIADASTQLGTIQSALGISDFNSVISQCTAQTQNMGPDGLAITQQLQSHQSDIIDCYSTLGTDHINGTNDDIAATQIVIAQQNQQVLSDLPGTANIAGQYASACAAIGDHPNICDGVQDLMGSLGGSTSNTLSTIKQAAGVATGVYGAISAASKGSLNTALASLKTSLNEAIAMSNSGGSVSDVTAQISSAMSTYKSSTTQFVTEAESSIKSAWTSVTGAVMPVGQSVKDAIGGVVAPIRSGVADVKTTISAELTKLAGARNYLKDFATASSLQSMNPCSKSVVNNVLQEKNVFNGTIYDPNFVISDTNKPDPVQQLVQQ